MLVTDTLLYNSFIINPFLPQGIVSQTFIIPALERQKQTYLYEFQTSQGCIVIPCGREGGGKAKHNHKKKEREGGGGKKNEILNLLTFINDALPPSFSSRNPSKTAVLNLWVSTFWNPTL